MHSLCFLIVAVLRLREGAILVVFGACGSLYVDYACFFCVPFVGKHALFVMFLWYCGQDHVNIIWEKKSIGISINLYLKFELNTQ